MSLFCNKCKKQFTSEKRYKTHIKKVVPCDYKCKFCDKKFTKGSYHRHIKKCGPANNIINPQLINNVSGDTNINASNTQNNNITNLNNMVMMMPFGLTHNTELKSSSGKESVMGIARYMILDLVKRGKFEKAYELLFKKIHGDNRLPEYHNIYMDPAYNDSICVFEGKKFEMLDREEMGEDLYMSLSVEMMWLVKTAFDIDWEERCHLEATIIEDFQRINPKIDITLEKMLKNNKSVVEETLTTKQVWPNLHAIAVEKNIHVKDVPHDGIPLKMY